METGKALNGKPYAGNPHVRFDEGEVASAATPRRGSLLYSISKLIAIAAIATSATLPMKADTIEIDGVTWTYSAKNDTTKTVTLGGNGSSTSAPRQAISTGTSVDAATIPWTFEIDGETYRVTKIGNYAFYKCLGLTGTLTIPEDVTAIGKSSFVDCSNLVSIVSLGGVTSMGGWVFQNAQMEEPFPDISRVVSYSENRTFENALFSGMARVANLANTTEAFFTGCKNLQCIFIPGPETVASGSQTYTTTVTKEFAKSCTSLKVILAGLNTKGSFLTANSMLNGVTGCKVIVPDNGYWNNLQVGGTDNEVIYYGGSTGLDIAVNEAAESITVTVTTRSGLEKALAAAPALERGFGWVVRINVPSGIDMTGGAVADGLLAANSLPVVFAVTTQAQLDKVLAAVPPAALLAIDPTGASEELTLPEDRAAWIYAPGKSKCRRQKSGIIIIVK